MEKGEGILDRRISRSKGREAGKLTVLFRNKVVSSSGKSLRK